MVKICDNDAGCQQPFRCISGKCTNTQCSSDSECYLITKEYACIKPPVGITGYDQGCHEKCSVDAQIVKTPPRLRRQNSITMYRTVLYAFTVFYVCNDTTGNSYVYIKYYYGRPTNLT